MAPACCCTNHLRDIQTDLSGHCVCHRLCRLRFCTVLWTKLSKSLWIFFLWRENRLIFFRRGVWQPTPVASPDPTVVFEGVGSYRVVSLYFMAIWWNCECAERKEKEIYATSNNINPLTPLVVNLQRCFAVRLQLKWQMHSPNTSMCILSTWLETFGKQWFTVGLFKKGTFVWYTKRCVIVSGSHSIHSV